MFVDSQSDLFHGDVPDDFIARVWAVMAVASQHSFQILTKRQGRMRSLLRSHKFQAAVDDARQELAADRAQPLTHWQRRQIQAREAPWVWPQPNVWGGVSVENQAMADLRIPVLLDTPLAVRFVSAEPLLGPVKLSGRGWLPVSADDPDPDAECMTCGTEEFSDGQGHPVVHRCGSRNAEPCEVLPNGDCALDGDEIRAWCDGPIRLYPRIDWVIAGGESGPNARPMHPDWARALRDQCVGSGIPFFFKQWGAWEPDPADGAAWSDSPGRVTFLTPDNERTPGPAFGPRSTALRAVRKKSEHRELDGRVWDEYPAAMPV